jgi:hypothetical protein
MFLYYVFCFQLRILSQLLFKGPVDLWLHQIVVDISC